MGCTCMLAEQKTLFFIVIHRIMALFVFLLTDKDFNILMNIASNKLVYNQYIEVFTMFASFQLKGQKQKASDVKGCATIPLYHFRKFASLSDGATIDVLTSVAAEEEE